MKKIKTIISDFTVGIKFKPSLFQILVFLIFVVILTLNFSNNNNQQYVYLSESFLKGELSFSPTIPVGQLHDAAVWNGSWYWPLGPFPAILLMPFVAFAKLLNLPFYQGYLQFFLTLGVFYIALKLSRIHGYSQREAWWLAFALCFASVYQQIAAVSISWYFVQVVSVFLIMWAFLEYYGKRRYWLIGTLCGLALLSRFTAALAILFFIGAIVWDRGSLWSIRFRTLIILLIPVVISGILLGMYNYARFGNPLENGYRLVNNTTLSIGDRFELLNYGLFKLENIPTNVYYYFIKTLDPVRVDHVSIFYGRTHILKSPYMLPTYPGTSFFMLSPFFFYLFRTRLKNFDVRLSLIPVVIILFFILTYYWSGWLQVGARYMNDLLPLLFLMILYAFPEKKLTLFARGLIIASAALDFWLLLTIFNSKTI